MAYFQQQEPQDVNYLRQLVAAGQLSEQDLNSLVMRSADPALAPQQAQQSPLDMAQPGAGYQDLQSGQGVVQQTNPDGSMGPVIRINSGAAPRATPNAAPRDWSRAEVEFNGQKGYYGKDGQAYMPDGSVHRFLSPQQHANNRAEEDRQMKVAEMKARLANVQEQTASSQAARARKESPALEALPGAGISQDVLEKQYGKADKGMRWKLDGTQEPLPGGAVQQMNQSAMASGQTALDNIDELIGKRDANGELIAGSAAHPGFETAVGVSGITGGFGLAGFIPGTDTTDFKKRLEQLKGGAFLQAFESLKGGGQITEVEGKKATAAITRMDEAQSEKEFVSAAREFRGVIDNAMRAKGGQPQASGKPSPGEVRQGYRFLGGNPADRSRWIKQ